MDFLDGIHNVYQIIALVLILGYLVYHTRIEHKAGNNALDDLKKQIDELKKP